MVRAQDASLASKPVDNINIVADPTQLFNDFIQSQTCAQTFSTFLDLCRSISISYPPSPSSSTSFSSDHIIFYPQLKKKLSSWKAQSVWSKLDKRFFGKEYFVNPKLHKTGGQRAGADTKVLIIGAGPCGLRTAIEMACLGTKVVVLEKRDNFSRNNVLHLWPFIITDLKALGAKKLYGKFCAGAIDHISIRQLQLILLKIALMLGVEVIFNVTFENLIPPVDGNNENEEDVKGWTAEVNPSNHSLSKYEFDVVIGADGKRNTLQGFKRKEFRGKLAIGLTVNFINRNTTAEAKVEEISGVAYIFNQEFFKSLHRETGIDLENIVYYKGETHYFVMTAKKHSLISKGVLKQDFDETNKLLSYQNVDLEAMMSYAREAADFSTHHQLPTLDFAINHFGQPDVALFDFTCMYAAENAALFRETQGHKLLSCLVGDSLLEPFWPMGTGCARGFLAAFDTVWLTKQWALKRSVMDTSDRSVELEVLAERESIYRLLHQTTPQNTMKNHAAYTIDPNTRYVNLNAKVVAPRQVTGYYLSDRVYAAPTNTPEEIVLSDASGKTKKVTGRGSLTRKVSMVRSSKLLSWCRRITDGYPGVHLADMSSSWKSGMAICALIHRFRPDLINWNDLELSNTEENNQLAFDAAEKQLGISPVMTGKEMAASENVDKLLMVTYISQFYEMFKHETPAGAPPTIKAEETKIENGGPPKSPTGVSLTSPVGLLTRFTQHIKRRSYSVQGKQNEENAKKRKQGTFRRKDDSLLPEQSLAVVHEHQEHQENVKNTEQKTMQIGDSTVKLRPSTDTSSATKPNVHQRASDRISALSNQLISQWEQNAPRASPRAAKRQIDIPELPLSSGSDKCYFCNRRVYIVERLSAESHFFHRQCFVCCHCGLTLRRGAYEYVKDTGKFYCDATCAAESRSDKYSRKPSTDVTNTDSAEKKFIRRYQTPERIELENIRISMLLEPEDIPEEALARHNFSGSMSRDRNDSPEEDMSDSSDDDVDWEMVLRKASADNQLQDNSREWLESSLEESDTSVLSSVESEEESDASMLSDADDLSPSSDKSSSPVIVDCDDVPDDVTVNDVSSLSYHLPDAVVSPISKATTNNDEQSSNELGQTALLTPANHLDETSVSKIDETLSQTAATNCEKREAAKKVFAIASPVIIETSPQNVGNETKAVENISEEIVKVHSRNSSKLSKYDTLDRVQDYLRATPLTITHSALDSVPQRQNSNSSSVSLSSSSDGEYQVSDNEFLAAAESLQTGDSVTESKNSVYGSSRSKPNFPRQLSADSIMINASRSSRSDTSVWSNVEGDGDSGTINASNFQKPLDLDQSLISEYKSCLDDSVKKSRTPVGRQLSYDSLERRMKLRLRARNRWLRDEASSRKTSNNTVTSPDKSDIVIEKPPTPTTPISPSSAMVIIEMTAPVDEPLTPTAPPKSRKQSMDAGSDQYYTPLARGSKSPPPLIDASTALVKPLDLNVTDEFVSAPTTPYDDTITKPRVIEKEMPALPKVPHLEAISPTGSTTNTLKKRRDIEKEIEETEERVKRKVEEIKSNKKKPDHLLLVDSSKNDGLDASFSGYSPVPSRKKTSMKKRNKKSKSPPKGRKSLNLSESLDHSVDDAKKQKKTHKIDTSRKHDDNEEKRPRHFFRFSPRKKMKKEKHNEAIPKPVLDSRSTLERNYTNQSDREKAIVRGERFRITVDRTQPSTSNAEHSDSPDEEVGSNYWSRRRRANLAGLTPEQIDAKITRRVQLAARRQARMEAQKRLRRAQVIQRQLEEIEVKQKDLEERGVELEKLLRVDGVQKEDSNYMQDWFNLVQEKNALLRYENELMIHQRELQLEDVQSRLQQDLRERMALDDKKKSSEELDEEKEILQKMLDVVEQRDELVALLEEQRIKEKDEFVDAETLLLNKFDRFPESNWSAQSRDSNLPS